MTNVQAFRNLTKVAHKNNGVPHQILNVDFFFSPTYILSAIVQILLFNNPITALTSALVC